MLLEFERCFCISETEDGNGTKWSNTYLGTNVNSLYTKAPWAGGSPLRTLLFISGCPLFGHSWHRPRTEGSL